MNIYCLKSLILLLSIPLFGVAQTTPDSVTVKELNAGHYEINVFKQKPDTATAYGAKGWVQKKFIPEKLASLPGGLVIVFDKDRRRLALYAFVEKVMIQEEHYLKGLKNWEKIVNEEDGSTVEKIYWSDEKLKHLIHRTKEGKTEHFRYTEDGAYITN